MSEPGPLRPIRVAYADPVYLGMAARYSVPRTPEFHPDAGKWDDPYEHAGLMGRLEAEFPDGWAYSLQESALRVLLPLAPAGVRVMAWVKPWVSFKPGVRVAWAWEPVLVRVRPTHRTPVRGATTRDWVATSAATGAGFFGAKPPEFSRWLFDIFALGEHPDDEFVDLFPGSGAVTRAWNEFRAKATTRGGATQGALFDGSA